MQMVKRNEQKENHRKQKAFDTWLRRCSKASWSHVRDALHEAEEHTLEEKMATNHGLSLDKDCSRRTQDDKVITCPRTAEQTGSMMVDATRDPHHGRSVPWYNSTQDPQLGKII